MSEQTQPLSEVKQMEIYLQNVAVACDAYKCTKPERFAIDQSLTAIVEKLKTCKFEDVAPTPVVEEQDFEMSEAKESDVVEEAELPISL